MKLRFSAWTAVTAMLLAGTGSLAQDQSGEAAYKPCAACHLPDGVGIPGAFPPIRNRAARIAQLDGGREYLISVVSYGLMGTIDVGGAQYFGVMAGNSAAMSADEIAIVLNYITGELNDSNPDAVEPFTAAEVVSVQDGVVDKSPQSAGTTRQLLTDQHGANWP